MPKKPPAEDYFNPTKADERARGQKGRWVYQNGGIEWPPDDGRWRGLNTRFHHTFVCLTCGNTTRALWGGAQCPAGHGAMHDLGPKLRVPRREKLLRWLKKLKEGKAKL